MTVIERERVVTETERRARVLEAAALEIEVRGWMRGMVCGDDGRVCAAGAILFASGFVLHPGSVTTGGVEGGWDAVDGAFGRGVDVDIQIFNDDFQRTAAEVTFLLRWRAEEIRDGR